MADKLFEQALRDILKNSAHERQGISTDPVVAGEWINRRMSDIYPFVRLFGQRQSQTVLMDAAMSMLLDEFKKAVIDEYIASGTADALDEVLRRK